MRKGFIGTKSGKRIFAVLLTLVMLLALLPATASAVATLPTEVFVGETNVTSGYNTPQALYGGTVQYVDGLLTLNGVEIPNTDSTNNAAIYANGNLMILFSVKNVVTGPNVADGNSYGIYVENGTLLVTSTYPNTDSLTVSGGTTSAVSAKSCGIYTSGTSCDITIIGAGTLTANGGTASGENNLSYGVHTTGSVTVQRSGLLTANGGQSNFISAGLSVGGNIVVFESAILNGTGGESVNNSYGLDAIGNITVSGSGSITGTGNTSTHGASLGVSNLFGDITVSDSGKLKGIGGTSSAVAGEFIESHGIYSCGGISVSGGELNGTGGTANGGTSYGVHIDKSSAKSITVTGGVITAIGGTANGGTSYGVYIGDGLTTKNITLTGGIITAIGNTAAVNKQPDFGTAPANAWYAWKESASTSEPADTEYKQSSMAQFTFSAATPAKYLKVMPIYSVAILTNGSASFTQGTATADAVFTIGDSISGFNATTNYLGLDPSGIQPDLGTIEMAGIDGKVEDGSIKITFYRSYLNTLAAGTHTVIVNLAGDYAGVSVPITFTITAPSPAPSPAPTSRVNPNTGVSALSDWIALAAIFGTGVTGLMTLSLKKRKEME